MSFFVATFLDPTDLTTWPPISASPRMRSSNRWLHRRSQDRFYFTRTKSTALPVLAVGGLGTTKHT